MYSRLNARAAIDRLQVLMLCYVHKSRRMLCYAMFISRLHAHAAKDRLQVLMLCYVNAILVTNDAYSGSVLALCVPNATRTAISLDRHSVSCTLTILVHSETAGFSYVATRMYCRIHAPAAKDRLQVLMLC